MKYAHVFADDEGMTHFRDVQFPTTSRDYAPPAPPVEVSAHESASGMIVLGFPAGWYGDYHPAPRKQWMIILSGKFEIGVSDGETRTLHPGDVVLADEAGSKGHTTRVLGDQAGAILAVEVP